MFKKSKLISVLNESKIIIFIKGLTGLLSQKLLIFLKNCIGGETYLDCG
jgi:hypothetical protein